MKITKRILAVILSVSFLLTFASCSDTTWVYKKDGKTVTSGIYLSMLVNAYMSAGNLVENPEGDLFTQKIKEDDGTEKDVEPWIKDSAKDASYEFLTTALKCEEYDLKLSEEEIASLDSQIKSTWDTYGSFFTENGASKASYTELQRNVYLTQKVFEKYFDKGGIEAVKDKDLKKFYNKNYAAIKILAIPLTDEAGAALADKAKKKAEKEANNYLKRLKNGENIDNLIKEYRQKDMTKKEKKEDDKQNKDVDNITVVAKSNSSAPEKMLNTMFKSKVGDVKKYVDDGQYIYLYKIFDVSKYNDKYKENRSQALAEYKGEDFKELMKGWGEEYGILSNQSALSRYSPKNIKKVEAEE